MINLAQLWASNSQLARIDTSGLGKLEELCIRNTQISHLDGSPLASLTKFYASDSKLTEIDTPGLERLKILSINETPIS